VHPNISGAFLLSEAFYKEIVHSKIMANEINTETEKTLIGFIKDYGYSKLDSMIGIHRITNLSYHWPFRDESKGYVDYRAIYRPKGKIDSLAFNVMAKQEISLMEAHEYLAGYYFKNGDYLNAWKEYNSLTKINPYRSLYYRKTGDCLLRLNDLPEAYRFFARSTEYEESFYAHFRAGEIYMIKNDFEQAIIHFQKAQINATKDEKEKALLKIYQALNYLNRANDGKEIAAYLQRLNNNKPIPIPPRTNNYKDYIPAQVKSLVEEAQKFAKSKDTGKAIALLTQSLEIKETPVVFRLLGELYYNNGEYEKSQHFLMKAYP
jgi:tetratricopeptide (TPR) repeat protein